ncbi:MAG TPA: FlgD immunoglobulin-like domain containing protein, partial [Bacteroidota bacterium]|nr:FlgD immunoglobulin-like domain containing protein [Bacteroidota bacterium]
YPNPFNPTTQIRFSLPNVSTVSLVVYNILGQRIATLASGLAAAGEHVVTWNGRDQAGRAVSSGVYFYRLQATGSEGTFTNIKKMLLLK